MRKKFFVVMGLSVLVSSFCFSKFESTAYAAPVENDGQGVLEKSTQSSDVQNDSNELNVSGEEKDYSDKTAEEISKELEEQIKNGTEEANGGPVFDTEISLTYSIDEINFPDPGFRAWVASNLDADGDGGLSEAEIDATKDIDINDLGTILDLTGIELFSSLEKLTISGTGISTLNLSGMTSIQTIDYLWYNNNLKSLDLRGCTSLISAFHSVKGEKVYISAGMLSYIGCPYVSSHTGDIIIDLTGYYTTNADGSKEVDLTKVLSPVLLSEFGRTAQPGYDPNTKMLTIPRNEISSSYSAGNGTWAFYTKLNNITDVVISYESNDGSLVDAELLGVGTTATVPSPPIKPGYAFDGWYADNSFTTLFDFSQPINVDTTVYAKWKKADITVKYESNGGSSVNDEVLTPGAVATKPANPTRPGYTFDGWYADSTFTTEFDFSQPINVDTVVYAKWRKGSSSGGSTNTSNTNPSTTIKENETKPTCPVEKSKDSTKVEAREESRQSVVKQTGSTYLNNLMVLSMLVVVSIAGTVFYTVKIENKEA